MPVLVAGRPRDRLLRLPPGPPPAVRDAGRRRAAGPVATDSGNQRFPDWAPDGRHLVFHSDRTGRFELYVVERDAAGRWSAPRQLTRDGGQEARWSPDGSAIVYVRNAGLWVIAPAGGAPRPLVETSDPGVPPAAAAGHLGTRWTDHLLQGAGRGGTRQHLVHPAARRRAQAAGALRRPRAGPPPAPSSPPTASACTSPSRNARATSGRWS